MVWIPEYEQTQITELQLLQQTLLTLLQTSQQNNILLARINRLPGVPVTMHIQFAGLAVDAPGIETDVQGTVAKAIELDSLGGTAVFDETKIAWAVSNPAIVQIVMNPDGTATLVGLQPGVCQIAVRDVQVGLKALSQFTVVVSKGNQLIINWGNPQP